MWPELKALKGAFEEELKKPLFEKGPSKELSIAIDYALSSGGKRLRPLLVLSVAQSLVAKNGLKLAMPAALAVEYIHTYSLIHDDLPSMDNDDFRRGKASLHRKFGEGCAILVGDALLADAFFLASQAKFNALEQCRELAKAAGRSGLVLGQILDISSAQQKEINHEEWQRINYHKTGKLFECAAVLGALSVNAPNTVVACMREMGRLFGESFQLKDDLDDNQGLCQALPREEIQRLLNNNLISMRELLKDYALLRQLVELSFT